MDFRRRYGPWALVTGASSGLGLHFARRLAERGMGLVLTARRAERLEALAAELAHDAGVQVRTVVQDLACPGGAATLLAEVEDLPIGLLVANAGFGWSGPFEEEPPAEVAAMVRLDCEAPAVLARGLAPGMLERGRGGIVVVASTAGWQPTPWMSLYGACKAFDLHLAEGLAQELRPRGVDVLALCPGHTATEFHAVAGVEGPVSGSAADPDEVVLAALRALPRRRTVLVPKLHDRLTVRLLRLLPRPWTRRLVGRALGRRMRRSRGDDGNWPR